MIPFSEPIGFKSLIVGQAWSTCYEMYFYSLLAVLLLVGISKKWLLPLIASLFAVCFSLCRFYPLEGFGGYLLSLMGTQHILFFCEGIVIALVVDKIQQLSIKKKYLLIVMAISIIAYITFMCQTYSLYISLVISPFFFIVVFKSNEIIPQKGIVHHILLALGDISFSIYLIHSVTIRFLLNQCHIDGFWKLLIMTLIVTILLSWLSYSQIEKRFIDLGKKLSLKLK